MLQLCKCGCGLPVREQKNIYLCGHNRRGTHNPRPDMMGENSHHWKGNNSGTGAIHAWIASKYGKANHCEHDNKHLGPYHWARLIHRHSRDIDDYAQLCAQCHSKYDHNLISVRGLTISERGDNCRFTFPRSNQKEINKKIGLSRLGISPWSKGLTKETDERVLRMSIKVSNIVKKWHDSMSKDEKTIINRKISESLTGRRNTQELER